MDVRLDQEWVQVFRVVHYGSDGLLQIKWAATLAEAEELATRMVALAGTSSTGLGPGIDMVELELSKAGILDLCNGIGSNFEYLQEAIGRPLKAKLNAVSA